jgi:hypothetical protein
MRIDGAGLDLGLWAQLFPPGLFTTAPAFNWGTPMFRSIVLALATLPALTLAAPAHAAPVAKEQRQLVVVSDLTTFAPGYLWLYKLIEANAVGMAQTKLGGDYAKINVMAVENATLANFHAGLAALAADPATSAIDVYVSLHGAPGAMWFHDGPHGSAEVRDALKTHSGMSEKLRALYSTACFGDSHADDWLAAGFRTASGSKGVNANSAYEYPAMMDSWKAGDSFGDAVAKGDDPVEQRIWDGIAANQMHFDGVDSTKVVHGDASVTIGELAP